MSPEGDSTAPPSQASERSSADPAPQTMGRITLPTRIVVGQQQQHLPPEPRGRGGGTGLLVGDQPPLDVDALLMRGSRRGSAAGASSSAKDSPTIEGAPQVPNIKLNADLGTRMD